MNNPSPSNTQVSPNSVLHVIRRRRALAFITAVLVAAGFVTYAFVAKDRFRAQTLVAVEHVADTAMPDPAARVREQLRVVQEVLFRDEVFGSVVSEFKLMEGITKPPERALQEIKDRIDIELDGSDGFYVSFEGEDRQQVAAVANDLAQRIVAQTSARYELRNDQETAVIDAEVNRLRGRLADLDNRIERYKESSIEELPERVGANLTLIEDLQARLREYSDDLAEEDSRRAGVLAEIQALEKQGLMETVEPAARSLNAERLDTARAERNRLVARGYTRNHPDLQALDEEVARLQALVAAEPKQTVRPVAAAQLRHAALEAELQAIDRRMASLHQGRIDLNSELLGYRQRVNSTPRHEQALNQLRREYDIARLQYEEQLAKQLEARRTSQLDEMNNNLVFRIVEPARAPLDPFAPNRLRLLLVGLLAAIGLGLGSVFLAEQVDSTFKDVAEFQSETGLGVLSIIPRIEKTATRSSAKQQPGITTPSAKLLDTIVTLVDPKSIAAEQFQVLATRLEKRTDGRGSVLMVSSSGGGEGKTITSVNLAVATSSGARVLLIDCDLRRPRVHKYLGLHVWSGLGLHGLLDDPEGDLMKYAWKVSGLTVLPGKPEGQNALKLLSSPSMRTVLNRLRDRFDLIVLDSPPILPIADGLVLGGVADQVLMVVRARKTTRAVLRRALESIDRSKLAGIVLNDVDTRHSEYSHVYRYYENTYIRGTQG